MEKAMKSKEQLDNEIKDDELPLEVRSKSLTEILSMLYVTIIMLALLLQILFG